MTENICYIVPNISGPGDVVFIDEDICTGCNACAWICRTQTILPNSERGKPPVAAYPDECWYCGCCVDACPTGALHIQFPIAQRLLFRRADTGEVYRIGEKSAPAKSYFKPPLGEDPALNTTKTAPLWRALSDPLVETTAIVSQEVCAAAAAYFQSPGDPLAVEKTAAILRLTGFDTVVTDSTELPPPAGERYTADFTGGGLSAVELKAVIRRACVSMYTAVQLWASLG